MDLIKFKKGTLANLPTLNLAEPGFVDEVGSERLYIGGQSGNVPLPNKQDLDTANANILDLQTNKANQAFVDSQFAAIVSGTPKGTYSTLSALQTAYPSGVDGVFLVLANGHWYYWNSTTLAWSDGGVYQSTGIGDETIGQEKLSFIPVVGSPSKNLFNKLTAIANSYIDASGAVATATGWYASDFIKVNPNTTYTKNINNSLAWYDVNKVFITPITTAGVNTITSPANTVYARLSIPSSINIDIVQFEIGNVKTFYESANNKLDPSSIKPKTITKDMLTFNVIEGVASKNLFDKSKVTSGYYVAYSTGILSALATTSASDYIPVEANTTYTKSNSQQFAYYDSNGNYLSGVSNANTFTTPANATYVRLTVLNTEIDTFQLEEGSSLTAYENFGAKVSNENMEQYAKKPYPNLLVVSKTEVGYRTITDAMANANDSVSNPVTILLMPGVYVESLILVKRYITIVGVDKETCIIKTYTNDYYHPPIDLSANAHLKNLTIIADDDGVTTPPDGVNGLKAYAIHHDIAARYTQDTNTEGASVVENCNIISKHATATGIGMANNQTLIFKNCEFMSYNTVGQSAFRAHNYMASGATNQKLIVDNCRMYNTGDANPITLQDPNHSQETGGKENIDTVFSFRNCIAWNETNGQNVSVTVDLTPQAGCIAGYVKLGTDSFGNNISMLNK